MENIDSLIRKFVIDGKETEWTTNRTQMIEHYVDVESKTFIDLGAADCYEGRAIAHRKAGKVVCVEGKGYAFDTAKKIQDFQKLENFSLEMLDVRKIDEQNLGKFDVVLCFGLLYHMQNPFNVLKRIRNICKETLILETHIAPSNFNGLMPKHKGSLPSKDQIVKLDGNEFSGRIVLHDGAIAVSKGSLDAKWTFWLSLDSIVRAVILAGFEIEDFNYIADSSTPEAVKKYSDSIGLGIANTKVQMVLKPKNTETIKVEDSIVEVLGGRILRPGLTQKIEKKVNYWKNKFK